MVAKSNNFVLKTAFGLKCKSPKATEKKAAKRGNEVLMCDFGREPSPKDGVVRIVSHIVAEHDSHA